MSEKSDTKKSLEKILGYELLEEEVQRMELYRRVASWTQSNTPGEGAVTKRNLIANFPPKRCESPTSLLDVSGIATTGSNGKSLFRLTDFICLEAGVVLTFIDPINVVVTPISSRPCFSTILHSFVKNQDGNVVDVEIQVLTWGANGVAAPNVSFNWRCRAPWTSPIF